VTLTGRRPWPGSRAPPPGRSRASTCARTRRRQRHHAP
jgi:hypothetical protein